MFAVLHSNINSLKSGLLHLTGQPYCKKGRSAKVKDGIINLILRNYLVDWYRLSPIGQTEHTFNMWNECFWSCSLMVQYLIGSSWQGRTPWGLNTVPGTCQPSQPCWPNRLYLHLFVYECLVMYLDGPWPNCELPFMYKLLSYCQYLTTSCIVSVFIKKNSHMLKF